MTETTQDRIADLTETIRRKDLTIASLNESLQANKATACELVQNQVAQQEVDVANGLIPHSILDVAPVGLYWTDTNGLCMGANAPFREVALANGHEQILGHKVSQLLNIKRGEEFDAEDRALINAAVIPAGADVDVPSNDGDTVSWYLGRVPLLTDGTITGIVGCMGDVSPIRELEQQLGQSHRLESIGSLAAGIAHEINTPLQYIGSHMTFLEHASTKLTGCFDELRKVTQTLPEETQKSIDEVLTTYKIPFILENYPIATQEASEGVKTVSAIVRAMKEFSHMGGTSKLPTDINRAILSTLIVSKSEYRYIADVDAQLDENLPLIDALEGELKQVFLNLIINASHAVEDRYGPSGADKGYIKITTNAVGDSVEICVVDNGAGMTDAVKRRIFDPFFTTKEIGRGTGQGLALANQVIVTKHGGRIDVESASGVGTTFKIVLPIDSRSK